MSDATDTRALAKQVFSDVMDAPVGERAALLEARCANDAGLRREVESLLRAAMLGADFLAQPVVTGAAPPLHGGSALQAGPTPEEAGSRVGPYRLLQLIGEGGFGAVYMAEQDVPVRRRVALKIIKLGMDTRQVIARFEAERQALAMMDHPNIAHVLDAGATESGRPYFVMELVRGIPITDYCDSAHLTMRERLALFIHVCHAVQHAHQKGIIHRDIKPSNVMVTLHDSVAVPKVIDFGIAKATAGRLTDKTLFTEFRQFIGTPEYMSPEQADISGLDVDTRSDVYSLGVLLYQLLTGTTPFDASQLRSAAFDEIQRIIREEQPHKPSTRLSTLGRAATRKHVAGSPHVASGSGSIEEIAQRRNCDPATLLRQVRGDLDWIVMKCLEKDRTRRYETVNALALDIHRFLDGQPVLAGPPSALYRWRKLVGRNRVAFAASSAVAAAVLLGLGFSLYGFVTASRERDAKVKALASEAAQHAAAESARAAEAAERARADAKAAEAQRLAYRASLAAAAAALQVGDTTLARRSLEEAPTDHRGWEWQHLHWLIDRSIRTLDLGVKTRCWTFSADQRRVIVGQTDYHVDTFDASSGEHLSRVPLGLGASYGISASADGSRLITHGYYGTTLLDLTTMRVIREDRAWRTSVSPFDRGGGVHVVLPARSRDVVLRDSATGVDIRTIPTPALRGGAPSLSPDGTLLTSGTEPGRFAVLDTRTGEVAWEGDGLEPRFAADGKRLICSRVESGGGSVLVVHDAKTGAPLAWIEVGHVSPRSSAIADGGWEVSADGGLIAVQSGSGVVTLYSGQTYMPLTSLLGLESGVGPRFSENGDRVCAMSWEGTFKVWNASTSASPVLVPLTMQTGLGHSTVSPDGRLAATGEWSRVTLWDTTVGAPLWSCCHSMEGTTALAFSPDSRLVAVGTPHGRVRILSVASGEVIAAPRDDARILPRAERDCIRSLTWSPDGRCLFAGTDGGAVRTYDPASATLLAVVPAHSTPVRSLAASLDGAHIVSASGYRLGAPGPRETLLWPGGDEPTQPGWAPRLRLDGIGGPTTVHPDGRRFAAMNATGFGIYSITSGELLVSCPGLSNASAAEFSADGSRLVIGNAVGGISLVSTDTGDTMLVLPPSSNADITGVRLPDARGPLVAASFDFAVMLFETGPPGPGVYETRERNRLAWKLVRGLFDSLTLAERVAKALRDDPSIEDLRPTALRIAAAIGEDPGELNSTAWGTVLATGLAAEEYAWAVRLAEAAVKRIHPAHVYNPLNTLGLARYRAGDFEGARDTLLRSDAAYRSLTGDSHPIDLAALAMACARLDRREEARTHLSRARELAAPLAADSETQALLREAEAVVSHDGG